jgi:hypothetical protein
VIYVVIEKIRDGIDSLGICNWMGLCGVAPSTQRLNLISKARRRASVPVRPSGIICDGCKDIVDLIADKVAEGIGEDVIEVAVDAACALAPPPFDVVCWVAFQPVIYVVIEKIRDGIDSLGICNWMGLCGVAPSVARPMTVSKAKKFSGAKMLVKTAPTDIFCDICVEGVEYIADLVLNGTIEPVIEEAIADFCSIFPYPLSTWCTEFFDQYLDEIIADITAGASDICSLIGLCASGNRDGAAPIPITRARRPRIKPVGKLSRHK